MTYGIDNLLLGGVEVRADLMDRDSIRRRSGGGQFLPVGGETVSDETTGAWSLLLASSSSYSPPALYRFLFTHVDDAGGRMIWRAENRVVPASDATFDSLDVDHSGDDPAPAPADGGWVAWSTDSVFTVTEIMTGSREASAGGSASINDRPGTFAYLGIWLPADGWAAVSGVYFSEAGQPENTFNQISTFETATSVTVDNVDGMLRVTTNARGRATIGGTVYWS